MKFDIKNTSPDMVAGELLEYLANKANEYNVATTFDYDMFIAKTIAETLRDSSLLLQVNLKSFCKFWAVYHFWDDVYKELVEIDKIGNEPTLE